MPTTSQKQQASDCANGRTVNTRLRRDIDDIDTLFDSEVAQRRQNERTVMIAESAKRQALLDKQDAAERERGKASMRRATMSFIAREYHHAGVVPPSINSAGEPTCSLAALYQLGWTVEEVEGAMTLIAPVKG